MAIRVSDLPQGAKQELLRRIREQIGESQYRELVEAVGEDKLLEVAVQQAGGPAPERAPSSAPIRVARVIVVGLLGAAAGALLGQLLGGGYWWIGGAAGALVGGIIGGGRAWVIPSLQVGLVLAIVGLGLWLVEKVGGVVAGILGGIILGALFGLWGFGTGSVRAAVLGAIGGAIGGGIDGASGQLEGEASHLWGGIVIGVLLGIGLDMLVGWAKRTLG